MFHGVIAKRTATSQTPAFLEFVAQLSGAAVQRGEDEMRSILAMLGREKLPGELVFPWQVASLSGLTEGFQKPNAWKKSSLVSFLESPPKAIEKETSDVRRLIAAVESRAFRRESGLDWDRPFALKVAASEADSRQRVLELVGGDESSEVQMTVLRTLSNGDPRPVVQRIIFRWHSLPPAVQRAAVDFCFRRRDSQKMFLEAIAAGKASASAIDAERREMMLVFSRDEEMKALAKKLFGASASNRAALIEQYMPSTKQSGTANKGAEVFKRVCASCHRLKGIGVAVGPELADVRQKAKETLLTEILDPNRTVEPRYASYIAALADGRTVVGLLSSESSASITLKLPNGVEETLQRSEIEQFRSSGRSLMPEGVEKDVTPAQMADLLEFLCSPN